MQSGASRPKRLLRQPGGFEGFLLRLVEGERGLLAVPERDQPRTSSLNLDAVSASKVCDVLRQHEAVLQLYRIDQLDSILLERLVEPLRERPDLAVPSIDACIGSAG